MTKLKGYIPTTALMFVLVFGSTVANAGIIVGDRTGSAQDNPCEVTDTTGGLTSFLSSLATFAKTGIIVGDRNGIIVGDRTGIIVGDAQDTCGIIVGD